MCYTCTIECSKIMYNKFSRNYRRKLRRFTILLHAIKKCISIRDQSNARRFTHSVRVLAAVDPTARFFTFEASANNITK